MRSASLTGRSLRPPGAMRFAPLLVAALVLAGALMPAAARAETEVNRARIVFVTTTCSTGSFACPGFLRALRTSGMRGRVVSPDLREDPAGTLSLLARQGYDLIVVELSYSDALAAVAPRFPKARFALFDAPLDWLGGVSKSNVQAVVLQPLQAAYLAGWLAARLEQRRPGKDVVGAVGGIDIPPVNDFIVGFRAGARSADPGIKRPHRVFGRLPRREQVRGHRTESDRARGGHRVQRRGSVRPGNAARRQGCGRVGYRRRHRPVDPRRLTSSPAS